MKSKQNPTTSRAVYGAILTFLTVNTANAQFRPQIPSRSGLTGAPYVMTRAWDYSLDDAVKLIELGNVNDAKRTNLIMVVDGKKVTDSQRTLRVTHWDGLHFATDYETNFLGTQSDALVAGRFRILSAPPIPLPVNPKVKTVVPPPDQLLTTEGVYAWNSKTLVRLVTGPPNLTLAVIRETPPDLIFTGLGSKTSEFQVVDSEVRTSNTPPPHDGPGYVKFGAGLYDFQGTDGMTLAQNIRYVQSCWNGKEKWMIGVALGTPAPTQADPNIRNGDRIVLYMLKYSKRDKSFWASKWDDFEEVWRSEAFPGRILDVRVGDPKDEGKNGILVLEAENGGKDRHLYFYTPSNSNSR